MLRFIHQLLLGFLFLAIVAMVSAAWYAIFHPETTRDFLGQFVPTPTPRPLPLKGIGVLGDSQSDEYGADDNRGYTYASTTYNWVELAARKRHLPFGEWGIREEPRRAGYEFNWARSGATVNSLMESGQHVGLAEQIQKRQVNIAIVYIGANDFAPYITDDGYEAIYFGTISDASLRRKVNRMVADMRTVVETLQAAGEVQILLLTIPDWGRHVGIQAAFPIPQQRERVSEVIRRVNSKLVNLAEEKGIATLDPNSFYEKLLTERASGTIDAAGIKLNRLLPSDEPTSAFLADGIHPGTVIQALFANFIFTKLNSSFGTAIRPFSRGEIRQFAGL